MVAVVKGHANRLFYLSTSTMCVQACHLHAQAMICILEQSSISLIIHPPRLLASTLRLDQSYYRETFWRGFCQLC